MRVPSHSFHVITAGVAALFGAATAAAMRPSDLAASIRRNEPLLIIDVRPTAAYTDGHIPGAINIPLGLLPHKPLPASQKVVVYGDGLGVTDESKALAAVRAKPGLSAELLEGGYAGWIAETRLTTATPGVSTEKVPGITYDQLVATAKDDVVLVDLRKPATAASSSSVRQGEPARAAMTRDVVADFAQKLGVPVMSAGGATSVAPKVRAAQASAATPPRAAAPALASESKSARLLVLVADSDSEANEAARQLRAKGHYRFTVLIGGTESIRHEGRVGTGRMDGDIPATSNRP